eukprot:CAMPEP_0113891128 /NCGR_PEP_ID=MMETSP0780_2-20120614/14569_1 /TAXON_ID=652834 /ORGANISM="Palpitomonas bilix" /LENGTH=133 /DNA_ID=CAMNT_0000880681 /DNA_START=225 /DNA_END=626 /DNA_ORIENTATION=- /assembly_acc=CAM_ASM_000599
MDIDLRGRLDGSGKRHGKVIEYAKSELAALDILENVCDDMGDYAVQGSKPSRSYVKYQNTKGPVTLSGISINSEDPEKLKARCEQLVEDTEDFIIKQVKKGKTKSLKKSLCRKHSKDCAFKAKKEKDGAGTDE